MLSLRELQLRFVASLYENNDDIVTGAIAPGLPSPAARLDVYRNNLREGFVKTLAQEFPVVEKLVGSAFFRHAARDYQQQHPSRHGDLTLVGAQFADYLRARFSGGDFAYLPDVAELEWALEIVAIAPCVEPLSAASFAGLDPARYEDLVFEPSPAARLVESRFPIVRIWQSHQPGAEPETIDLAAGGDRVLVRRRGDELEMLRLTDADFGFARMLARRTPLGLATDAQLAVDPGFDLPRALRFLTQAGAFARAGFPE